MVLGCNSDWNRGGKNPVSIHGIMILLAVFLFLGCPPTLIASSNDTDTATTNTGRFDFHADHMRAIKDEGSVEYIGNVVFPLGRSVITADNIKVFFKKNTNGGLPLNEGSTENIEDSVEKFLARGNVKIVFEGLVATGDEAVYDSAAGSFTVTGDSATLVNIADTTPSTEITAGRIVFNRAEVSTEFTGDVTVTHGETIITADNIKAFFKKSADGGLSLNEGSTEDIGDAVEKIIGNGNVKIVFEDHVATGNETIYESAAGKFVLIGDPATLTVGVITSSAPVVELIGKL